MGLFKLRTPLSVIEGVPEARFLPEEAGIGIDEAVEDETRLIGNLAARAQSMKPAAPASRMVPWPVALSGRLEKITVASKLLRTNPLGDPHERPLWIYLPPDYPDQNRRFASVYLLPGYGGSVASWARRPAFWPAGSGDDRRGVATGQAPQAIVVSVDGWTPYGGSQYSGVFGALVACMRRPDVLAAAPATPGEAFYEVVYQPRLPEVVRGLRSWDGDVMAWWRDFQAGWPDVRPAERMLRAPAAVHAQRVDRTGTGQA